MASNPYILLTGPLLMGQMLSFFLNGAFAMQLYHYYMNYASTDRRFFVYLVCFVVALELTHMCLSTHTAYVMLADGFANPAILLTSPVSGAALPAVNGAVGFCTQIFFTWRILTLTKNVFGKVAASLIALTAGTQMAAGVGVTVQYTLLNRKLEILKTLKTTVIVWLAGSFACDVLITITMVFVLVSAREQTWFTTSKSVINALIVHAIENGMITTVCALVDLICFLVYPDNWFYVCFEYLLGRLYANVLLATLNGRQRMRNAATADQEFSHFSTRSATRNTVGANQVQLNSLRSYPSPTNEHEPKPYTVISVSTDVRIDDEHGMPKNPIYP